MSDHSKETSSGKETSSSKQTHLTKDEVKKIQDEIDLLTNENQDLDDEINFAQEQLNRLESTSLLDQEKKLQHTLADLSEKVETLMEATEALEQADLLDESKVTTFTDEAEQKLDKEIESLKAELTETQQELDQLQKQ
ncbi:hypothetical protein HPULCUR_009924 [Helicostylum pulchrum]|uniref:Uncharacterized protein n=1 Tax=Helicostylum pulchrum TaxID=562976 RepID=A0ABP9YBV3_9FUNG